MEKKELSLLQESHLTVEQASALFDLTVEDANLVKADIGELAGAALTELETNATALRSQVNRSQTSRLTVQVNADRKVCTDLFGEIKKIVVFETGSREAARKTAANDFKLLFEPYWNITKGPIGDQIDQTNEMLVKFSVRKYASPALLIGLTPIMTELSAANGALNTNFKARELEDGQQAPSGTNLRPAAAGSYIRFCSIIEQVATYTPNAAILELFTKMDMLRKRYHALIPPKKDKGTTPTA